MCGAEDYAAKTAYGNKLLWAYVEAGYYPLLDINEAPQDNRLSLFPALQ